jgi:hypothetical protein
MIMERNNNNNNIIIVTIITVATIIKKHNESFDNVGDFQYLQMALPNQNYIKGKSKVVLVL